MSLEHAHESSASAQRYLACSRLGMENQSPPRDDNPSEMTDFEKNTTFGELEQFEEEDRKAPDANRMRQERGNEGPDKQPGFGQGAMTVESAAP